MRTTLFVACLAMSVLASTTRVEAQSAQDKAIAQEIGAQLKSSGQLRDYRIGVKYKDGVAALSGTVANQQQLITAVRLTQSMNDVNHVVNNLTITGAPPAQPGAEQAALRTSYQPSGSSTTAAKPLSYQQATAQNPKQIRPQVKHAYVSPQRTMAANSMRGPRRNNMPLPMGGMPVRQAMAQSMGPVQSGCNCSGSGMGYGDGSMMGGGMTGGSPMPIGYVPGGQSGAVNYDNAQMPGYSWPSYASYPNYAALSYPQQYSPTAWPYIGPFYPYPQVPLGWRKVCLEWDDGWWFLDFSDCGSNH